MIVKKTLYNNSLYGLLALFCLLTSCARGSDPMHGMFTLTFPPAALCTEQRQSIEFQSPPGAETVIEGAAIVLGSDPEGNFKLVSVRVGGEEIPAVSGILNEIRVPPETSYAFVVGYTSWKENAASGALLDIVYRAPRSGVIQVALEGSSGEGRGNCAASAASPKLSVFPAALPPKLPITVERVALVSNLLPLPLTTDPESTVVPFEPVRGLLILNSESHAVTLPPISKEARFLLPPSKIAPIIDVITDYTTVTSQAAATGIYGEDGSITLENVPIRLEEQFGADLVVTLTTGEVSPKHLPKALLRTAGFTLTDGGNLIGSPINPRTMEVKLVGVGTFTNPWGTGMVAETIGGSNAAVLITAKVHLK
jgi:hypothetical protein